MEIKTRLLCKSQLTYFSTDMPVYFYGMPNGRIFCFFARFLEVRLNQSILEFVFAVHEDFTYDYESGKIIAYGYKETCISDYAEIVNSPDQRIRIMNVYPFLESYADAHLFLNTKAQIMRRNLEWEFV
ncbi:MAG TPA: hypothetical protein VK872_12825 [Draconibacterium sp.]|jgi:hypothetical protein|nr:hypothetical protein [Draconibacterium sp.]